ncbi:MAG: DUF3298 and DUF4163 domain-containing protein, partial [Oscillospiraceae bacterium]|nr:DUF3298 and DUF4163 domain-containing protein [Oscillospiraceae bacterium]
MKKLLLPALTALLLAAALYGCAARDADTSATPPASADASAAAATEPAAAPPTSEPLPLTELAYSKTFPVSETEVLYATAKYPQTGLAVIDAYFADVLEKFDASADQLARDLSGYTEDGGGAAIPYELDDSYELKINGPYFFSVHRTIYSYMGGIHPSSDDKCDTFLIAGGRRVALAELFTVPRTEYTARLIAVFQAFMDEAGSDMFFSDAADMLSESFPEDRYSVTEDGLEFYFPPIEIAPYAY